MAAQWWKSQAYVDQFFPSSLKFVKVKILSQNKKKHYWTLLLDENGLFTFENLLKQY